jgi:hypothetical protein
MAFSDSSFSAASFSGQVNTANYISLASFGLLTSLGYTQITTALNVNVTVDPASLQLIMSYNPKPPWVDVDDEAVNVWTPVAT